MKQLGISRIVSLMAFILALASPALGQTNDIEKRPARMPATVTEESPKRIHRDASKRLRLLANRYKEIADPVARIRVQARIADALWQHDEALARRLFGQAYDDATLIRAPATSEPSDILSCGQVRSEILRLVSQHDPTLAAKIVAHGKANADCGFGPRERNTSEDGRSVMLVQVADSVLAKDPMSAARLAHQSLSGGIVSQFPGLCTRLKEVNSRLGNELMDAAIEHIQREDINALELVSMNGEIFGEPEMKGGKATLIQSKKVDAALATRFLSASLIAITRFVEKLEANQLAPGTEHGVFSPASSSEEMAASFFAALTELLPGYERYNAEGAVAASALLERLTVRMDPVSRNHMYVFYDNGDTPESLVAEAEVDNDERTKDELYELAAELADGKESFDHVLKIVGGVTDVVRREALHDSLLRNQIFRLLDEKRADEARQLIDQFIRVEWQVDVLVTMAERAAGSGNSAEVLRLLDEARDLLMTIRDGQPAAQARRLMEIARMMAAESYAERGFKTLKEAIDLINTLPAISFDARTRSRYTGELRPSDPLSIFCTDLRVFELLARADYFQALKLTQAFSDQALSLAAQLAVLRVGLSK